MMPRKSLELHALQGTKSQVKDAQEDDSKAITAGRLKIPPEIKADPKRLAVWRMLFSSLHRRRTLTKADSAAAYLLVEQWIMWQTVNAEAQARPFSQVIWVDKNGDEHSKTVESAASKMAAAAQRQLMQQLKEFSATPASRAKTKPAATPPSKNEAFKEGTIGWINEQVAIARASQQQATPVPETTAPVEAEKPTDWNELLERPI